ncbi:ATP-binding protein [Streptomyces sp. NPDC045431]|uniref:ATP-binding protein n=1 Tax=Streptomyces sp. NPDC045431 TaxID=3155613 RepID=UPI0033DCC1C2
MRSGAGGAPRPSMRELIERRRRAGFVGREREKALFRENFATAPDEERHRFLFHVRGDAGVGKTTLVRELLVIAGELGAVTAYVDEDADSVPDVMAAISAAFARQGHALKALDRQLATYRQRRHEAELSAMEAQPDPGVPSAGSTAVAQAGLIAAGMLPVVGAFTGAVDPAAVARRADRIRAVLAARFHDP